MSCIQFTMFIFSVVFFCCFPFSLAGNNETDKLALLQIKSQITDDPLGVMSSWNHTLHFCEWYGVKCGRRHERVRKLDLNSSKLAGIISPYIGNLSFLTVVHLQNNSLGGTIPPEIGHLDRLKILRLGNNSIGGNIPWNISSCSRLTFLDIQANKLVGEIPHEIGLLSYLQILAVSGNNLMGILPVSLGNLSSVSELYLCCNDFIGRIPDILGKLTNLKFLTVSQNKLFGLVPPSIFNLSSLTVLDLGENKLEGSLPSDLGFKFPNLGFFSVYDNEFTGSIPSSISNLSKLNILGLSANKLQGQVPSLVKLESLKHLSLSNNSLGYGQADDLDFFFALANSTELLEIGFGGNKFGGILSKFICNFTKLSLLGFEHNKIGGEIPTCIENLVNLNSLTGWENQLSGVIPQGIGKLSNLNWFNFHGNNLSGSIPSSMGNLTQLTKLLLDQNNIKGQIPSVLENCKNILELDLSQNNLSGEIPIQLFSLSTLVQLDLSNNHLSGYLPAEVDQLKNLEYLGISKNILSGQIPGTLSGCIALQYLNMSGNFFKGPLPDTLDSLKGLNELDLSRNNFSGEIPKFLASLPLQLLDLSHNNLEGEVPTGGVFSNASILVYGNNRLCGGIPALKLPHCNSSTKTNRRRGNHSRKLIIAALFVSAGVILMVALSVIVYSFWYRKRSKKPATSKDSEKFPNLSYHSISRATNGFSPGNLIGSGSFGDVYKGTLDEDGTIVAVKVFKLVRRGAYKSFMAECEVLRTIRHRNLVKVITACASLDSQRNDFKALVYEYMVNGSLEDWLHQTKEIGGDEETNCTPRTLTFHHRLDIVVDVAFALEYLHYRCGASIVHCDLKPSNVLLDEDLVAHVSDFGLAKFLSEDRSSGNGNNSSSIGVRGTIGYTPPEYGLGNGVSSCGDAYSFGILIMEMFTGKRPIDDIFRGGVGLHQFVEKAFPDQVTEILDQAILEDIVGEHSNSSAVFQAVISILQVALSCSVELPQERLNMSEVASMLSSIRNKLLGTRLEQRRRTAAGN